MPDPAPSCSSLPLVFTSLIVLKAWRFRIRWNAHTEVPAVPQLASLGPTLVPLTSSWTGPTGPTAIDTRYVPAFATVNVASSGANRTSDVAEKMPDPPDDVKKVKSHAGHTVMLNAV